ncbi:MND1-interacting protein 1-like [Andrographis paniculata]|uniref:MND1-interacting protein 1-like n=1 Tax=Andrographis paniculata TaxID=175694 RepID=UPI0021E8CF3E|nr:MND1-interacting protein 1-like [Andrographis paniculata]
MGCTVKAKHTRANRSNRSAKLGPDRSTSINCDIEKSGKSKPRANTQNHDAAPVTFKPNNPKLDDEGWGECTEEQLEGMLLKKLDSVYNQAIEKLVGLGYSKEASMNAILRNGHCYGGMDALSNIMHNALVYLKRGESGKGFGEVLDTSFSDLRQLEEFSISRMISLLQKVKPHSSRGDAMMCLLMHDLNVRRASFTDSPVHRPPDELGSDGSSESGGGRSGDALYKFHGGWGFGNDERPLRGGIECPKRFNLSPSMRSLLKRNVAVFAAGLRSNSKQFQRGSKAGHKVVSGGDSSSCSGSCSDADVLGKIDEEYSSYAKKNQQVLDSVMDKFQGLNLDENSYQNDEMVCNLNEQIADLEQQVKVRKEWAYEKATQAARKLSHDLAELKMLRLEREERQRQEKEKPALESATMKGLREIEDALKIAGGHVERVNAAVGKLEVQNAEFKAELEAYKLRESESAAACMESMKREKKCRKKLIACEKQTTKLQQDIAVEKQRISELQQAIEQTEIDTKEFEEKWRQEQKSKAELIAQIKEERRLLEAAEANNKRKLESLRQKTEMDLQRQKDDLQRLEQEYARLKQAESQSTGVNGHIAKLLMMHDREKSGADEIQKGRRCTMCMNKEVSVVFLPCTHQVICSDCNNGFGKKGRDSCPYCMVPIEQRIQVYGAGSS